MDVEALGPQLRDTLLQLFGPQVGQRHASALGAQGLGKSQPQATGGARDEDASAGEEIGRGGGGHGGLSVGVTFHY